MMNFESMITRTVLLTLAVLLATVNLNAQAEFSGNVREVSNKKSVSNVKIMVVTESDTAYYTPDKAGNFNFKNKAGKTKVYAISDDYISEINAVNTTNGSKNTLNIAMVPTAKYDAGTEKRSAYSASNISSYQMVAKEMKRKACALPGLTPIGQTLPTSGRGILTATEVNDFARWGFWKTLNNTEFGNNKKTWKFVLATRIVAQFKIENNTPVVDAIVDVVDEAGNVIWTARTDNTGKAELWPDAFTELNPQLKLHLVVHYSGEKFEYQNIKTDGELNDFVINKPCAISDNLDIAFVVDATGSMGDEINFIKNDLDTFIKQVAHENKDINIRLGSVFYRDFGDDYVAKYSPFSSNSHITDNFILDQSAGGGGDYPEAVPTALEYAIDSLEWSESARARMMFLILDAGAHNDEISKQQLEKQLRAAAQKGIKIIPVICSGLNKIDEALMRSIALTTNGTNIFLTSHSGVGNQHIQPSSDNFKIETLSELLSRITKQYSIVPECDNKLNAAVLNSTDTLLYTVNPNGDDDTAFASLKNANWVHKTDTLDKKDSNNIISKSTIDHSFVKIYPNPTVGPLKISTSADIKIMYLADVSGKLLQKIELNSEGLTQIDISRYSSGVYFLKYPTKNGWGAERIVLQKN